MWLVHAYWWLEANNLYKAAVAFFVTLMLGLALGAVMRPWKSIARRRATQEKIADSLDTSTPGGLTDLVHALRSVIDGLDEGEAPDDNGTDHTVDSDDDNRRRKRGVHGKRQEAPEAHVARSLPTAAEIARNTFHGHGGGSHGR